MSNTENKGILTEDEFVKLTNKLLPPGAKVTSCFQTPWAKFYVILYKTDADTRNQQLKFECAKCTEQYVSTLMNDQILQNQGNKHRQGNSGPVHTAAFQNFADQYAAFFGPPQKRVVRNGSDSSESQSDSSGSPSDSASRSQSVFESESRRTPQHESTTTSGSEDSGSDSEGDVLDADNAAIAQAKATQEAPKIDFSALSTLSTLSTQKPPSPQKEPPSPHKPMQGSPHCPVNAAETVFGSLTPNSIQETPGGQGHESPGNHS